MASTITGSKRTREGSMVRHIVADSCPEELQRRNQHQDEGALLLLAHKKSMNNKIVANVHLQELLSQWQHQDEGALFMHALSFLDVKTLLQKETVNKRWRKLCKETIDAKCGQDRLKAFQSNEELRGAPKNYCKHEATSMEEIACSYGYPMDNWDVSHIQDMSSLFEGMELFNENIGSWDVSMKGLCFCLLFPIWMSRLCYKKKTVNKRWRKLCKKPSMQSLVKMDGKLFNPRRNWEKQSRNTANTKRYGYPMGKWEVSHVEDMSALFEDMGIFNEYIGSWDVSNVTNMRYMFEGASCFNQDIGSWDVSNVTDMRCMFYEAGAFNQNIGMCQE
jgi:surface protein